VASIHHEVIICKHEIKIIVIVMQMKNYWRSQAVMCTIKVLISQKWYNIETLDMALID